MPARSSSLSGLPAPEVDQHTARCEVVRQHDRVRAHPPVGCKARVDQRIELRMLCMVLERSGHAVEMVGRRFTGLHAVQQVPRSAPDICAEKLQYSVAHRLRALRAQILPQRGE